MTTGAPDATFCACLQTIGPASPFAMAPPPVGTYPATGFVGIAATPSPVGDNTTFAPIVVHGDRSGASVLSFDTIATNSRTLDDDHAKPGKLAAVGPVLAGGSSVFIGSSRTIALQDGASSAAVTAGYMVAPSSTPNVAANEAKYAVSNAVYIADTQGASAGPRGLGTKITKTVQPSGPIFSSSLVGSGVSNTPKPGQLSLVDFGTIDLNSLRTLDLAVNNLATDASDGNSDLIIEGYAIAGADSGSFSADITPGSVVPAGGTLLIPLMVVGTGPGDLTSTLTIFTNQGTSLGGAAESFNYLLDPMVVIGQFTSAPEPASLAIFGVGLAGIGVLRLRHRRR